VKWLTFAELDERSASYDEAVLATPETDRPCASSDWILPAQMAFAPAAQPRIVTSEHGYVALMSLPLERGARATVPLEAVWQLASPVVGPDPERLIHELHGVRDEVAGPRELLVLAGLAKDGVALKAVISRFHRTHRVHLGPLIGRCVASLEGGLDGFLSRRSAKFRANLMRSQRIVQRSGARVEYLSSFDGDAAVDAAFERIRDVESRSWKGLSGTGMNQEPSWSFYLVMARRLARRGALRVLFIHRDGRDVAFVFGGLFGGVYRGQQASFDDTTGRESMGSVGHLEMIVKLCDEGVSAYDLGSDLPYKRRWGEPGLETVTVYVVRR
jgi:CelD/BcsL family acetyltransferase involved in cellulose biosynthesis